VGLTTDAHRQAAQGAGIFGLIPAVFFGSHSRPQYDLTKGGHTVPLADVVPCDGQGNPLEVKR
jgi:hypothetical protein